MITGKEMEKLKIIPPDAQIYAQVKASWDKIAKPLDGLGQFETMFAQIGAITGSSSLSIEKKVILTMCADNGVVAEGVSQSGQEVTAVVAGFMGQQASSVGKMARRAGVDVIPVDIGIKRNAAGGARLQSDAGHARFSAGTCNDRGRSVAGIVCGN